MAAVLASPSLPAHAEQDGNKTGGSRSPGGPDGGQKAAQDRNSTINALSNFSRGQLNRQKDAARGIGGGGSYNSRSCCT